MPRKFKWFEGRPFRSKGPRIQGELLDRYKKAMAKKARRKNGSPKIR